MTLMFLPIAAVTRATRRAVRPTAYDCIRFVIVREGSILPDCDLPLPPVLEGEAALIGPTVSFGYQPEGASTVTAILVDTDYLIERLFWQYLDLIPDREAARDLAANLYTDPVLVLHLGERNTEHLGPILDELATRTATAQDTAGYFRTHALLMTVLEAVAPHVRHTSDVVQRLRFCEQRSRSSSQRWQTFRPVRREAAQAAGLLRGDLAKRWHVQDLAAHACLSASQLTRVFKASFGMTPMACLAILRVRETARLLRDTHESVAAISERVGWASQDGQASRSFRKYMGTSPSSYRRHGLPTISREGAGFGVGRAAKLLMAVLRAILR